MISSVLLLAVAQTPHAQAFDAAVTAHRKLPAASVKVTTETRLQGISNVSEYDVAFIRPDKLSMRIKEPQTGARRASDRSYYLIGQNFYALDRMTNDYIHKQTPAKANMMERMGLAMGGLSESVQALVDPGTMQKFLGSFKTLSGWTRSSSGGTVTYKRTITKGKESSGSEFVFDGKTKLLRKMQLTTSSGFVRWSFVYGQAPKGLAFSPPSGSRKVSAFYERPPDPIYSDQKARQIAKASLTAYERLEHVEVDVTSGPDRSHVWVSRGRVREKLPDVEWTLVNGVLTVHDKNRQKLYRGKAALKDVGTYLAPLNERSDPVVRQLLTGNNPLQVLMPPHTIVRHVGEVSVNGATMDILEIMSWGTSISAWILRSNQLLHRTETSHYDNSGEVLMRIERNFKYASVGKAMPAEVFVLKGTPQPLSTLAKIKR